MKGSTPSADSAKVSPRSQRSRRVANAAATDPHTSKRTSRVETTRLNSPGVDKKHNTKSSGQNQETDVLKTDEASLPLSEVATPKNSRPRKGVKQEVQDIHEQDPLEEEASPKRGRRIKKEENQEPVAPQIDQNTPKAVKRKRIVEVEEAEIDVDEPLPKKAKRKKVAETEVDEKPIEDEATPKKAKRKTKGKEEEGEEADEEDHEGDQGQKGIKRKRKTKEERELEAMPLAARTDGLRMLIGAHVSGAKGVHNSVTNCVHIGGNAFAMFLKSQKKWENPPLQDDHRDQFKALCSEHNYDAANHILPHGSYLVNLAQEDADKAKQAYTAFLDDLKRCESLGIRLYNFHPGWTGSRPRPSAIARIAQALNRAHAATKTVTPVLETMAGGGNVVGSTFEDLRDIIALVDDKARVGVCLDTCHVHAAGYDLRQPAAFQRTLDEFDRIVGIRYLCALHLNDSKAPFGSHRDLHQNIGLGFLGLRAFHSVMNEPRFEGLPMVLETPIDRDDEDEGAGDEKTADNKNKEKNNKSKNKNKVVEDKGVWAMEIKMLEGLIGLDAEGQAFKALEKELADRGAGERVKYQEQFERKAEKDRKALEKGQTRLMFGSGGGKKKEKVKEGEE